MVVWAQRRFGLARGRVSTLYVAAYTAGRGWIEMLRIESANHVLGLRLNMWTSALLFIPAIVFLIVRRTRRNTVGTEAVPSNHDHLQPPDLATSETRSHAAVLTAADEQAGPPPPDASG